MKNSDWNKNDLEFKLFEDNIEIPDENLSGVPFIEVKTLNDLDQIPKSGGCYWIWTNESVNHSFHNSKIPDKFNEGEIIYNGISKDDIRGRLKKHLFGKITEGMSAISVDLILEEFKGSHRKKALSNKGNTAFSNNKRIRDKDSLKKLNLSVEEFEFIENSDHDIHFRNGINITDKKHLNFDFKVFYLCGFKSASYADIIEKKWRDKGGLPRLCTYKKGR